MGRFVLPLCAALRTHQKPARREVVELERVGFIFSGVDISVGIDELVGVVARVLEILVVAGLDADLGDGVDGEGSRVAPGGGFIVGIFYESGFGLAREDGVGHADCGPGGGGRSRRRGPEEVRVRGK